jgi:phosphoglycerate kinase
MLDTARTIARKAEEVGCTILLPEDVAVAARLAPGAARRVVSAAEVETDAMILDVGPATIARIAEALEGARTLVWNGPLGAFEVPPFDEGTVAAARQAARLTRAGALLSVAGGGDTVAALNAAGVAGDFTYVSTAGGAFLEWLEGRVLPGVAALEAA